MRTGLMRVSEVARVKGVTVQAVYHAIKTGTLPGVTEYGLRLVPSDAVAKWQPSERHQNTGKLPKKEKD